MGNPHVGEDLPAYVSGNLDEAATVRIRSHLATCDACREELDSVNRMWNTLAASPDEHPDASLSARFNEMLKEYQEEFRRSSTHAGPGAGGEVCGSLFPGSTCLPHRIRTRRSHHRFDCRLQHQGGKRGRFRDSTDAGRGAGFEPAAHRVAPSATIRQRAAEGGELELKDGQP